MIGIWLQYFFPLLQKIRCWILFKWKFSDWDLTSDMKAPNFRWTGREKKNRIIKAPNLHELEPHKWYIHINLSTRRWYIYIVDWNLPNFQAAESNMTIPASQIKKLISQNQKLIINTHQRETIILYCNPFFISLITWLSYALEMVIDWVHWPTDRH